MNRLATAMPVVLCLLLVTISAQGGALSSPQWNRAAPHTRIAFPTVTFSLDGVTLELTTSFLSDLEMVTSDPDSAIQMATAVARAPLFREFSVTAVPFGTAPPTESLPPAGLGQEGAYRTALRAYREGQGGEPRGGAVLRLFGAVVPGSTSVVRLPVRGETAVPVAITEWVVEAGPRLWIVRASLELEDDVAGSLSAAAMSLPFSGTILSSRELSKPSTSLASLRRNRLPEVVTTETSVASDLPIPSWWMGECDTVNFEADTGFPSYPLGAAYRGMKACGPRPWPNGPWRYVDFGVGQRQIEWQCPEISKRFLYLAYGIPPYGANGNDMVDNYPGDLLEKVWNCTVGRAPQPDDVLSYGATTTYGHTSVVVASDVDATGDGTIEVIEQNSSADGHSTLNVDDWCVTSYTDVIGWLHHPDWFAEYYADASMTDRCASESRPGLYLFESWGDHPPADGCPADNFGARFSRSIEFAGGDYVFALGHDDVARLMVDGETVVDGWGTADQHYVMRHLDAGYHQVTVEYADGAGDAALTAFWWGPGFELVRDERVNSHWYAEHWGNEALWWDPVVTVVEGDGPLNHQWSWDAPADNLPSDHFSSRFRRIVSFEPGRWRFDLFADDGVRLWIDDVLIVDAWQPQRAWFTPTVTMGGGDHELVVEHWENEEVADILLDWTPVSETITSTGWVTLPLSGTVVESCPITVEAQVGSRLGAVDRVEFHAHYDGQWHHLGDDDTSPYGLMWDCRLVRNQTTRLMVHVWNEAGIEFIDLSGQVAVDLAHLRLQRVHLPLILQLHTNEH